jgi:ankyrin repeat protein
VDAKDDWHKSALISAATTGRIDIVKLLLEKGADVNLVCDEPRIQTSLIGAALVGHIDIVMELIRYGANIEFRSVGALSQQSPLRLMLGIMSYCPRRF